MIRCRNRSLHVTFVTASVAVSALLQQRLGWSAMSDPRPEMPSSPRKPWHPGRIQPVSDPTQRLPWNRLIPLVAVETLGVSLLLLAYLFFASLDAPAEPLLLGPVVTYVLVFATSGSPASRPLRVLVSYAIAGVIGLGVAALPGPTILMAILGTGVILLLMHLVGAFHAPAVAVALIAEISDPTWSVALVMFPALLALVILAVVLVWATHQLLGDRQYPDRWW